MSTSTPRSRYLSLHLTAGLLVTLMSLALFAHLAAEVRAGDRILLDQTIVDWQRAHATIGGRELADWVSRFGSGFAVTGIGLIVGFVLFREQHWLLLAGWSAALLGNGPLNATLKELFRRTRPNGLGGDLPGHSWSFPSGHSMNAIICYGMLAYVVCRLWVKRPEERLVVICVFGMAVAMIGVSRMYLNAHYFSDVVAGFAAGAIWLTFCVSGLEVARKLPKRQAA